MSKSYDTEEVYSSTEAAEIIRVSEQKVLAWCEKGKYPGADRKDNGTWQIPKKYFKITLEEARKRKDFEQKFNESNKNEGKMSRFSHPPSSCLTV